MAAVSPYFERSMVVLNNLISVVHKRTLAAKSMYLTWTSGAL